MGRRLRGLHDAPRPRRREGVWRARLRGRRHSRRRDRCRAHLARLHEPRERRRFHAHAARGARHRALLLVARQADDQPLAGLRRSDHPQEGRDAHARLPSRRARQPRGGQGPACGASRGADGPRARRVRWREGHVRALASPRHGRARRRVRPLAQDGRQGREGERRADPPDDRLPRRGLHGRVRLLLARPEDLDARAHPLPRETGPVHLDSARADERDGRRGGRGRP